MYTATAEHEHEPCQMCSYRKLSREALHAIAQAATRLQRIDDYTADDLWRTWDCLRADFVYLVSLDPDTRHTEKA